MRLRNLFFTALVLVLPLSLRADVFSFSYSGVDGIPVFGSGTFTANLAFPCVYAPCLYDIVGITGAASYDGVSYAITGLLPGNPFPDNVLYFPPYYGCLSVCGYFDISGVGFFLSNGGTEFLYAGLPGTGVPELVIEEFAGNPFDPGVFAKAFYAFPEEGNIQVTDLSVVAPEPSTFVMFGTGLIGVLAAARRRLMA